MLCADDVKSIHRVTLLFRDALDPTISRCSPGVVAYSAMNNDIIAVYILGVSSKPLATFQKRFTCIVYCLCSVYAATLLADNISVVV